MDRITGLQDLQEFKINMSFFYHFRYSCFSCNPVQSLMIYPVFPVFLSKVLIFILFLLYSCPKSVLLLNWGIDGNIELRPRR